MALSGFNVMVLAEDAVGACFITYGVIAGDEQQAAMLASGSAQAEGYWSVAVEEAGSPDDLDPAGIGANEGDGIIRLFSPFPVWLAPHD